MSSPMLQIANSGKEVHLFLEHCLAVDLETGRQGRLYEIGALLGDHSHRATDIKDERAELKELDVFAQPSRYLLGHNILHHDLPYIRELAPGLGLLKKPVIDTLYLSALAFPQNPYHRLVKDYKLVRDSISDPVADARLTLSIFRDQWQSFETDSHQAPGLISFYRYCFEGSYLQSGTEDGDGLVAVFSALGGEKLDMARALAVWLEHGAGRACPTALAQVAHRCLSDAKQRPMLAYILAWLRVAGGNSVLPPWVRHRFPEVPELISQLREQPCNAPDCDYCNANHDPVERLQRYFGYESYRPTPDGRSLQQEAVAEGMRNRPLLAILPTGGGKSLCYQIPALVRYERRGALTVVISPLQALMKDQVDNLRRKTDTNAVAALYGMLTPPERGEVLEGIRLGDVGLLYISPEQLRNRSLRQALLQREIGAWVFDEAHCLSKWGHDFRPDYLYAARFIRELAKAQQVPAPPVACYTATAKQDVIGDIINHFQSELDTGLLLLNGGSERENLHFEVHPINSAEKYARTHSLLEERLGSPPSGGAVIYCATRKNAESAAEYLEKQGWVAAAFHAGLGAPEKRRIQEAFIAGEIPVICATNAFGMGIDKDDVRVVIHADIPGSLENYLQEAGRAGRDEQEAECILLYDAHDIETQFSLGARSELNQRDIAQILRGIRRARQLSNGDIVLTSGELLRDDAVQTGFDADDRMADTKVKTAVAWLERGGFLERDENDTRVFQGKPVVTSLEEADQRLDRLNLPPHKREQWRQILEALINADVDDGITADELAGYPGLLEKEPEHLDGLSDTQRIIRILHQMAEAGLVRKGMQLTAFLRPRGKGNARLTLERIRTIEAAMVDLLQEEAPDAAVGEPQMLSLRRLNQRLVDNGVEGSNPALLARLLESLAHDGKGMAARQGSLDLKYYGQDRYQVTLRRDWVALKATAEKRRAVAKALLEALYTRIPDEHAKSQTELLVDFTSDDLLEALKSDMELAVDVRDPLAAIDRGLMFLHEQKIIILQKGLAVFRQAMTIRLLPHAKGRSYTKGDYQPLSYHYSERIFQVHVMNEYARLGLEEIRGALKLVGDYFAQSKHEFVRRYFPGRESMLDRATGEASYREVVESLQNPNQQAIVTAPPERNMLVLAGPGSGKTRTVVHRCAYLLRIERVPPRSVLILCFNHNAKLALRQRLWQLIGPEAAGVTVLTYHGLAMRLTGASFATQAESGAAERRERLDFDRLIQDAIALLRGDREVAGLEHDELRERLLAGYRHILVDEYQDIDPAQYELISAIAGRTLEDADGKLSILAVGDDDQSIYGFRDASVRFIRQFHTDYDAETHSLVENYRSSAHIIAAANELIDANCERMKHDQPIVINRQRADSPPGGAWQRHDPIARGRVQVLCVKDGLAQAQAVATELKRLKALKPDLDWRDCAILSRAGTNHAELCHCRAVLEAAGIPISWPIEKNDGRSKGFPLHRIREIARLIQALRECSDLLSASKVIALAESLQVAPPGPWEAMLMAWLEEFRQETGDAELPATEAVEFLHEALAEQRREQRIGSGVFLSTAHAAKGMEFAHVFVLDGHWGKQPNEEERRLYYVAMTRAQENLILFERTDCANPYSRQLRDETILCRDLSQTDGDSAALSRRYALLGLSDLYLDYAARQPANHRVHQALAALRPGTPVMLRAEGESVVIVNSEETVVGKLSKTGAADWRGRLDQIRAARVVACLCRYSEDADEKYRSSYRVPVWELPVVEIEWAPA